MRAWTFMLGGMIVWTVHFFAIYIVASIFLTSPLARGLTLLVTFACLAANCIVLTKALRTRGDEVTGWRNGLAGLLAAISLVAVLWQGLPAVLA